MNYLPLPDEILKMIYQYIHPAFEYEKYILSLKQHQNEKMVLNNIINSNDNIMNNVTNQRNYLDILSSYSRFMQDALHYIESFEEKNTRFIRHQYRRNIEDGCLKIMWEYDYDKNVLQKYETNLDYDRFNIKDMRLYSINKLQDYCISNRIHGVTCNDYYEGSENIYKMSMIIKIMSM